MSLMSRTKGIRAEKEAAAMLRALPGFEDCCRRATGSERFGAGGNQGRDLENTPGFAIQVKATANPRPLAALAEAQRAAADGEIAIAVVRQSSRSHSTGWAFVFGEADAMLLLEVYLRFAQSFPKRIEEMKLAREELTEGSEHGCEQAADRIAR